jgi:hypothetical protein
MEGKRIPPAPAGPSAAGGLEQLQEQIRTNNLAANEEEKTQQKVFIREAHDVHAKVNSIRNHIRMNTIFNKQSLKVFFTVSSERITANLGGVSHIYTDYSIIDLVRSKLAAEGYHSTLVKHDYPGDIMLHFSWDPVE